MGIKNFRQFLREYAPSSEKQGKLSHFRGKRVAIDGHNWMYKYMAIAQKTIVNKTDVAVNEVDHSQVLKIWLHSLTRFVGTLTSVGVSPIFIIDGPSLPEKQANAHIKRKQERQKQINKLAEIEDTMNQLGPLRITPDMVEAKRKILRTMCMPKQDDIDALRDVLFAMGIPCMRALDEAEKLCTSLCIEGYVSGVISTDNDNLVFGCPMLITKIDAVIHTDLGSDANITYLQLDDVLEESKLDFSTFIDYCIMAGCDYNTNIRGIGIKRGYEKIKQYGNLDEMSKHLDTRCLNYPRCREIFDYKSSNYLLYEGEEFKIDIDLDILRSGGNDILDMYNLRPLMHELLPHFSALQKPKVRTPVAFELSYVPCNN